MNIIKYRYFYFAISLLVIVPGIIGLILWGFPLSIDFTGGSLLEIKLASGTLPAPSDVVAVYQEFGYDDSSVQTSGKDALVIRTKNMDENERVKLMAELEKRFNAKFIVQRFDTVGPSVGQEVAQSAAQAIALAALGIMLYISYAFRGVSHAWRYGVSAVIAMIHDILVVCGVQAILAHFLGWEVDSLFLTALLTVIGFSVHDTIVVYDRIRENSNIYRRLSFEEVVNHSLVQTMTRSLNTQLTVLFTLLALVLFGGITIRHFVTILLIGVFSGTYSSIFNAAPILVVWEYREWRTWFRRGEQTAS